MKPVSRVPDWIRVSADDERLVANAGLLVVEALPARLGIGRLVEATVRITGLVGGARPGRKVLTLALSTPAEKLTHAFARRNSLTSWRSALSSSAFALVTPGA